MSTIDINKKYRTRDGRGVRILCVDLDDSRQPVVAFIEGDEGVNYYTKEGFFISQTSPSEKDLIEVREPRECLVSVVTRRAHENGFAKSFPVGTFTTYEDDDENDGFEVIRVREVID